MRGRTCLGLDDRCAASRVKGLVTGRVDGSRGEVVKQSSGQGVKLSQGVKQNHRVKQSQGLKQCQGLEHSRADGSRGEAEQGSRSEGTGVPWAE